MIYRLKRVDGFDDEDADLIRTLHDACFGNTAPQVDPERGQWWVAYTADDTREAAGFCGLTPTYAHPFEVGYLKRAGVLPWHRGAGLQRRFVRVREARARRNGWSSIVTDTTDNPASANNLIACGFRIYEPPVPWGYPQTIYWRKEL